MSHFIISRFNIDVLPNKKTALLEFIPLIDVSISIGTVEHKLDINIKSYYLVADPLRTITAVSMWHIDITKLLGSSFEILFPAFNAANSNCCLF